MPLLRRPLYQRNDGADEDRWGLVFDTDASRLFIEREKQRGDMRGPGYGLETDEVEIAEFLKDGGLGRPELLRLVASLFEDHKADLRL
jgi:hypothetical protein